MMMKLEALRMEAEALPALIREAAASRNLAKMRKLKTRLDDMPIILADAAISELENQIAELTAVEPAMIAEAKRARAAAEASREKLNEVWREAAAAETADNAAWSRCYTLGAERDTLLRRVAQIQGILNSHHALEPAQTTHMDVFSDVRWLRDNVYMQSPLTH